MAETLYIKYRPLTFDSVVGQQHIVKTLQNAIKTDRMAHAYMFCGPRGTGKTTMARILAKACLCAEPGDNVTLPTSNPCGHCTECNDIAAGNHPDVYELDAASRTGVENVREEIIGRVNFAATRGAKKIYIIDEVHMLSIAAFNALLKTLEEPPEHVVFILCTTDPQKVPETILSRCQRFDFRAISVEDIAARLAQVCEQENVTAEEEALKIIAQSARGGMRNALTTLEQMFAYCSGSVTAEEVRKNLGSQTSGDLRGLLAAIAAGDLATAFTWLDNYNNEGADYPRLTQGIIRWARAEYLSAATNNKPTTFVNAGKTVFFTPELLHLTLVEMGELANNFKVVPDAKLAFEVCIAKLTHPATAEGISALAARVAKLEGSGVTHSVVAAPQVDTAPQEAAISQEAAAPQEAATSQQVSAPQKETTFHEDEAPKEKVAPQQDAAPQQNAEADATAESDEPQTAAEPQPSSQPQTAAEPQPSSQPQVAAEPQPSSQPQIVAEPQPGRQPQVAAEPQPDTIPQADNAQQPDDDIMSIWRKALVEINEQFPAYGAILTSAKPTYKEATNQLILTFPYSQRFAAKQMNNDLVAEKISSIIKDVSGKNYGFGTEVAPEEEEKFDPIAHIQQQQNSAPQKIDNMRQNLQDEMNKEPATDEPKWEKPQPQSAGANHDLNDEPTKKPNPVVSDEDKQDMTEILSQFGAINIKED